MRTKLISILVGMLALTGCKNAITPSAYDVVDNNISVAVRNFEVNRRIIFYNIRTGEYVISIEGRCVKESYPTEVSMTCKTGPNKDDYKRYMLGLNGDVTFIVEQLDPLPVDSYHYRVIFRPATIIPNIEIQ